MRFNIKNFLALFLLTTNLLYAGPRVQPSPEQKDQKVVVSSVEVPVDVIVRDKGGRPVKGLSAADFEVYENGVRQAITSVRVVTREPTDGGATPKATRAPNPATGLPSLENASNGVATTALVFDRLSPEARTRARDAALNYVNENMTTDCRIGVYVTGLSLDIVQPLTEEVQLVRAAVERTGLISGAIYISNNKDARKVREQLAEIIRREDPKAPPRDGFQKDSLKMQLNMMEGFEALQRDQQGQATINGLITIINSLREIPGRKAVIFLSEGIALPPAVEPLLRTLISTASAAGVSVYAIDAAGLRVESTQTETKNEVESRSNLRMAQLETNVENAGGPMTKGLERNEDLLKLDPHSGLGILAEQTGGFLINNTNDLKGRMNRIGEELRTYYLLSYAPRDQSADGQFRRVEVKVKRSGVTVQNRKGYYAINTSFGSPVLDYETPALAIASSGRRPKDLIVKSSAMTFPETTRIGLVAVLAEIPMQTITVHSDETTNTFSTDFSVVVIFKSQGKEVTKLSHHYTMTGPLANVAGLQKGNILFYGEGDLEPGRYQMQTVVYDAFGKKAGVHEETIDAPNANVGELRLSSLVLIMRAERLNAQEQKEFNPFHIGELLAYPNLGEAVLKTKYKQLPFYFTVYLPKETNSTPKLVIELAQQGRTLAQIPGELPLADASGRMQFAGGLPLESIAAGEYELKVIVTSGAKTVTRSTRLVIE